MKNRITSSEIKRLLKNQVFVFGSNGQGKHIGGSAKLALEKFGAIDGKSEGLQGKSYGINTMDGLEILKEQIERFIRFAAENTDKTFLVTEIGCGIAGYSPIDIAILFEKAINVENIHLPKSFWDVLENEKEVDIDTYTLPPGKVIVTKSVKHDMTAYGGFKWKNKGVVIAKDFKNTKECGNGLHGWLWGIGDFSLKVNEINAKWLMLEVDEDGVVELNGKVKFEKCRVVYCGNFQKTFLKTFELYLEKQGVDSKNSGHSSAQGNSGHSSAQGKYGHSSAQGKYGHSSAQGDSGHSSAQGNYGHSSAQGDYGHSSAQGKYGLSVVQGNKGKARCGDLGAIVLTWWDGKRFRHTVGYEGESIKANVWYELDDNGNLIECKNQNI